MRFEKKGSGAIIFVGEIAVKASSVDRAFSMGSCAKSWATLKKELPDVLGKVAPEPVSSVNLGEWKAYQTAFAGVPNNTEAVENAELARMKERHRDERKRALSRLARYGLPVLNIARHCLMRSRERNGVLCVQAEKGAWRQAAF